MVSYSTLGFIGKNHFVDSSLTRNDNPIKNLVSLGLAMEGTIDDVGNIPAAYTYFGQFLSHELMSITLSDRRVLLNADRSSDVFVNKRHPLINLESIYGSGAVFDAMKPGYMCVGKVAPVGKKVPKKSDYNDLPRNKNSTNGNAAIAEVRNDQNLCLGQLHVAMLRAHNNLVSVIGDFNETYRTLCGLIKKIIVSDYLPRICCNDVLRDVWANGPRFFRPSTRQEMMIPIEFVAAFRFGHSMVRSSYNLNCWFENASLGDFFSFTAESGNLFSMKSLMRSWIIDWSRFSETEGNPINFARKFGPVLAEPLSNLRSEGGKPFADEPLLHLAVLDLLWGYHMGVPSGQSLAICMEEDPLCPSSILEVVPERQRPIVERGNYHKSSPLFFYVLVEAATKAGQFGLKLGPVGSRIIAETFWNIISFSDNEKLCLIGLEDRFTLSELLIISEKN